MTYSPSVGKLRVAACGDPIFEMERHLEILLCPLSGDGENQNCLPYNVPGSTTPSE